ncbi:hypothetical protein Syun_028746 [Stephania yunnanensis]|uniref:F-box domain-containing protein n=1 Tax=Stephania yunnanensis TaxID=152371 RepID=A0AAP0HIT8_9MAGN
MKEFNLLEKVPEDCISTILSLTTPRDACRSSLVSSSFRLAVDSDVVWERFLPSNYQKIVSTTNPPLNFSSKKELFFHLQEPLLIDGGTKSFWLDRSTGSLGYMQCARELWISNAEDPLKWSWKFLPESRFGEVAELVSTSSLEIKGKIKANTLSTKTTYIVNLIVKFTNYAYGLDSIPSEISLEHRKNVSVGIAYLRNGDVGENKYWLERIYYSNRTEKLRARIIGGEERKVRERSDGWMEIELGEFVNDGECEEEEVIKVSLMEVKGEQLKGGIVIEGIEVRPKA